jgi:hypothetical protein
VLRMETGFIPKEILMYSSEKSFSVSHNHSVSVSYKLFPLLGVLLYPAEQSYYEPPDRSPSFKFYF